MTFSNLKIRAKLLIIVTTGLLISFSIFGAFRIYQTRAAFIEEMNRSGKEQARLIAESVSNMIIAYDYGNIESVTERIVKLQDVKAIRILNSNGKLMASQLNSTNDQAQEGMLFTAPVIFSGNTIGQVELEFSLKRMEKVIRATYRNVIFVILLIIAFLSTLIYFTVSGFIITPLIRLADAAKQLAQGNFTASLPPASNDELGDLTNAFSSMRESRKKVEDELNNLNASLEGIVTARIAELRDSEAYIHAVLDNVGEGIIVVDKEGLIVSFNNAAEKIFGQTGSEMINQSFSVLVSAEDLSLSGKYRPYDESRGISPPLGVSREVVGIRKDFSAFPLELKTSELHIQNRRLFITSARDISERKAAEQRIRYMASHDALTNLPNRTLLQDRIQQALVHNRRNKALSAVLFIDLDKFKVINDTLGHDVGDGLLQEAAARLSSHIRAEDTLARQGGDEFIILLNEIKHAQDAGQIAQKLLATLTQAFHVKGKELHISASIGIAIYPDDGESMEALLKNSDTAMYHAKESGRNNFQYFSEQMNRYAAEKQLLSSNLRHAIDRNELRLVYQPICRMADNEISGMEALLRWEHPEHGLVSPDIFIPLAEETGLILNIGEWVFRAACAQIRAWKADGYAVPRIAINLSAKQFRQKSLAADISAILRDTGLNSHHIGIELTESMLLENVDDVVNTLRVLSEMGLEISIDDFGTGYSSLSYLKRFTIHKLKIDKSFVDDMTQNTTDADIVAAIISMAHSLKKSVVIEGVETREQLDYLRGICDEQYQGYLYSRPLSAEDMALKLKPAPSAV